ncbi:hypothetical protein [Aestuariimicrobium ganziense]|uniref:hypothetical protein n=1 Tax=Aestuariimicrobium ganziense TaxID=2773677 RepID=UPI0019450E22|nr:hypothetical protein [Aestuariimicrobium ganziense]
MSWAYRATAQAMANGTADTTWVHHMIDFIDARIDLADQRLMVVLALRLGGGDLLPQALRDEIDRCLVGFRHGMDDVSTDSMCTWTENHQAMFAVGEFLSGQLLPDKVFSHTGFSGAQHRERGRTRLLWWLEDRFRHGFSEWLSGTFYELDIAALTLLVEHSQDDDLTTRASMVLDLMLLDMALHRFEGRFVACEGRAYRKPKMEPVRSELNGILAAAFGAPPRFDPQTMTSIFVGRSRYQVPRVLDEIARADGAHLIRTSHGRDPGEAVEGSRMRHRDRDGDEARDDVLRAAWGMQAFTTPETVGVTLDGMRRLGLASNRYLAQLGPFLRLSPRMARATLRALNPITTGLVLPRANIVTHRTPRHVLSSTQHFQPGEFGDQQSLWMASLPNDIRVFGTHPGASTLGSEVRSATPSAWVGNGINPDIGQVDNVLLVLHDLRLRRGYLEGRRHELSHLYFPFVKFDESTLTERMVAARKGDSFIGVVALNPIEMSSEDELLQRGTLTGWAVVLSDRGEYSSLSEFTTMLKAATLDMRRTSLVFDAVLGLGDRPRAPHRIELRWKQGLRVDGVGRNASFGRYDCAWVQAPRGASTITVTGRDSSLRLNWTTGTRSQE